jgi:hypothetical protein
LKKRFSRALNEKVNNYIKANPGSLTDNRRVSIHVSN